MPAALHTGTSAKHARHRHPHTKCFDSYSECAGMQAPSAGPGVDFESNYLGAMPRSQTQQLQEAPVSSELPCRTQNPTQQQLESVISAAINAAAGAAGIAITCALEAKNLHSSAVSASQELPTAKVCILEAVGLLCALFCCPPESWSCTVYCPVADVRRPRSSPFLHGSTVSVHTESVSQ